MSIDDEKGSGNANCRIVMNRCIEATSSGPSFPLQAMLRIPLQAPK
jgi:hypothetical protein